MILCPSDELLIHNSHKRNGVFLVPLPRHGHGDPGQANFWVVKRNCPVAGKARLWGIGSPSQGVSVVHQFFELFLREESSVGEIVTKNASAQDHRDSDG